MVEYDSDDGEPLFCHRVFDPTAAELIGYYLRNHILGLPYPESGAIQEDEVYGGELSPWEKFCDPRNPYPWKPSNPPKLFLFTRLADVGTTQKSSFIQKSRTTGCGTWHVSSKQVAVAGEGETVIGNVRVLQFRSRGGGETVGQWSIYEYTISAEAFPEIREVKGWHNQAVCMIRRDDDKTTIGGRIVSNNREGKKRLR